MLKSYGRHLRISVWINIMTHWIPSKYHSLRHHQPWINRSIKQLFRHKQHLYNRACHSGLADDWDTHKQLKRYTQQQCKDAYNDYIKVLFLHNLVAILNIFGLSLKVKDWIIVVLKLLKAMAKFIVIILLKVTY